VLSRARRALAIQPHRDDEFVAARIADETGLTIETVGNAFFTPIQRDDTLVTMTGVLTEIDRRLYDTKNEGLNV